MYAFVQTLKNTKSQIAISSVIFYGKWAENQFTEQPRIEEATMKCGRMESGLKLKGE